MTSFQEYMTGALAEAGLTDEQVTSALTKIYANEKLSSKLNGFVKTATEDYNAQVGRAQSAQAQLKEYQDWFYGVGKFEGKGAKSEYDRMQAEFTRTTAELARIAAGGAPDGFDSSKYMTREDFQKGIDEFGGRMASVVKDGMNITAEHVSRFKEKPDLEAIEKIAMEQKLPLRAAYEKYIEPRVKEQEADSRKNWEKQRNEEIERDVRSRYKLPVDPKPEEISPLQANRNGVKGTAPADMDAELMAAWHGADSK